jgi:putative DNA primase/helicase
VIVHAARDYIARGWRVIPVPFRSKKPTLHDWPALRLNEGDISTHFNGQPSNIGGLLGEPSGGLTDYATSADFTSFLAKKPGDGPREDIARLAGARLVTSVETRDGQWLAEGLIKVLTGGDTIAARRLYERAFEFVPRFKLLLASNYRPSARADDDGLWRRLRELPFPTARLQREERDDTVKATITDPAQAGPAMLAWAVEGCARWLAGGLGEPETVMQATAAYRSSQEPLAEFIADCCHLGADERVTAERLRAEYETWCRTEGIKSPVGGKTWGAALRSAGCTDRKGTGGARWWDGIAIRDAAPREPVENDPPW